MKKISKQATIIDMAKELGISPSTVSRALSNHPDIKHETKVKVKKLAKVLRYYPNPIAQSLRSNQTKSIGVLVPEIKHDFFSSAISGMEDVAYKLGYTIILCQSNENYKREVVNINMLMHHRVAGVLVSISQNTKNGNHFQDLTKRRIPLVFFDRVCEDVIVCKVVIDDYKSAFDAVNYLIEKGYKRIAHLGGPKELDICRKRKNGYLDALRHSGISIQKNLIRCRGMQEQDGYASIDFFRE